jgi:hypothetical protein
LRWWSFFAFGDELEEELSVGVDLDVAKLVDLSVAIRRHARALRIKAMIPSKATSPANAAGVGGNRRSTSSRRATTTLPKCASLGPV